MSIDYEWRSRLPPTDSVAFLVVISLSTTAFWLLLRSLMRIGKPRRQLPPGPRGLPVVGYLPFLGPKLHQDFMDLALSYGPIYKISIGTRLYVIISSPSLVKEVVRDHDVVFANRNPNVAALAFSYGGNDIAFSPYGSQWRKLRRLFVGEMQSNANLDALYDLRRNEVLKTVESIRGKANANTAVDIGELAFTTVVNMISGTFWGGTLEASQAFRLGAELRSALSRLTTILSKPNVSDFFPWFARFDLQGVERDMKEVSLWIDRIFDFVIAQREEQNRRRETVAGKHETRSDFLQLLLECKDDEESGTSISEDEIKALLMDIVVGGTGTTSTTVEWTMTEILLHPNVYQRVCEELEDVVGIDNAVEECHISRLPYLHAVVKETMRLRPVAPLLLPRSPARACTVGGFAIPEGCKVFLNVWAMHRDPRFWDNPSEFRPERFLQGYGNESRLSYSGEVLHYLPFGSGRRMCAGLRLGERMLMHVLAAFLHAFDWEVPEEAGLDSKEKFGIVLEKATPLVAIPKRRASTRTS